LTILIVAPSEPANLLYLIKLNSGSIPVVIEFIMKLIVPLGANKLTWAFLNLSLLITLVQILVAKVLISVSKFVITE